MALWWTVVPPSQAHFVVSGSTKFVACPDEKIGERKAYFAWPSSIPWIGREIRIIPLTIQEINVQQETYEKGQARYHVTSSTKYRVLDVRCAAETIYDFNNLNKQLEEIIKSATRAVTSKYYVTEARSQKPIMQVEIQKEISDDFSAWGLQLMNFQLADFSDTPESKIITNISRRREVEIETTTQEQNADKQKQARIKVAEADEAAKTREIARDRTVLEREQNKIRDIAEQAQQTKVKEFEVIRTATIKQAEIDRDQAVIVAEQTKRVAIVNADQEKEVAAINREMADINKDKLRLEGEGEKLKAQEIAIGMAATQLEQLLAEAKGKTELQIALSKFDEIAIRAMTAQQIVSANRDVGLATAKALESADIKLFSGGDGSKPAFDLGALISSASVANPALGMAINNKIAMPNDLGLNKSQKSE